MNPQPEDQCDFWRKLTSGFVAVRVVMEFCSAYIRHGQHFDQHYMMNDHQLSEIVHISTTITFLVTGNWYCGLWTLLQSWFLMPSFIIRLDGGTKIILIHRVFQTAMSVAHILAFFICGIACVFILVFGDQFAGFNNWVRAFPKTLALITGEFDIDAGSDISML